MLGALGAACGLVGSQFAAGVISHLPSKITRPQGLRFLRTFLPSGWRAFVWLVRRPSAVKGRHILLGMMSDLSQLRHVQLGLVTEN